MESPRWNIITPSQYEWERRGLDFIRTGLPDHDPYRAWANFEFQTDDGAIYEVDLLVLTKQGFWLVECKAWGGRISGDSGTWTRSQDGKTRSEDNPVVLANRKAKALASLLKSQSALSKIRLPWLDAVVFLSADDLQCELADNARNRVLLKDRPKTDACPERKGILAALINRDGPGIDSDLRGIIDIRVAKALSRAMEQAGIRPSQRSRRVGDYILGDLIFDGPGYQDRLAKHASFDNVFCRVRQYTVAQASSEEDRQRLKRAAAREFQIIQTLDHTNILPVLDYKEHELGPALLFRYLDPNAVRFDHYLATQGHKLETGQRLDLLRQIVDAIQYAHRKRVIHRSLGPQSILVLKDEGGRMKDEEKAGVVHPSSLSLQPSELPRLQVYNWQVGVRENTSTSGRVTNVEDLVEAQSLVYMSPEALSDSRKVTEASDVFSLGAIAFHLFANRPPASNPTELAKIPRDQKGLSISSVMDGAGPKLEELIQWSTHPDVLTRIGSVEDFLTLLADVEDELTAPKEAIVNDPLQAKQGDRLPQGFLVKRELGQGATAKALLVTKDDKEFVLKVALTDDDNTRLHEEADALRTIHSEFIVAIEQELKMSGRTVLVLQKAGDNTLAAMLAKEGVPSLELLARYGDDLLSAVCSLERHGVVHRDIKPDNIGIRSLTKQRNQLILFDFSLARAPLDNFNVGTEGYRDPFLKLRKPARWDLAAERYSAAVTLYEMTLGHGVTLPWCHSKSDSSLTDDELVLDAEKFDASVRDGLVRFFSKALHREPEQRFDNAYDMQTAWRQVFKESEQRKITTTTGEEIVIGVTLDQATLGTPVSALGLSTRARNALERANVITVRDLLNFPIGDIHLMKGVGNQTRQEIIRFVGELREKFPNVEASKPKDQTDLDQSAGPPSLESLRHRIVCVRNPKNEAEWNIRAGLLGVFSVQCSVFSVQQETENRKLKTENFLHWPSQTDVAEALGITRARVGQVVSADRHRSAFRHELCEQIQRLGGVVTIAEIIDLTILLRPAANTLDTGQQQRLASAVARAAVETEDMMAQRRFQMRRVAGKIVVACSQELAVYAEKLGQVADQLADADPLASPIRVFQELYEVQQPPQPHGCQPFSNERLLNLAAAMSQKAAVSSRQEVYPRGMAAERVLRLGIGALSGLGVGETEKGFSVEQVRDRVKSRYPAAEPLPDRPELDALLHKVGLDVRWDADSKLYQRREAAILFTSGSSIPRRHSTATSARHVEVTPDVADARSFEDRLQHAYNDGGFLVLTVRPSRMRWAEAELLRRFELERVSFDDLLFEVLRHEAKELEVDWNIIEQADGADPASQDWKNLLHLIGRAGPKIASRLAERREHLLLVHPGLIARYDLMAILETLRDKVGHDDLTHIIDTSGMGPTLAGHGTPTVILLGRNRKPVSTAIRAVLGIKGEPSEPEDHSQGFVWQSIIAQIDQAGAQNEYISTSDMPRTSFATHPWSIGGGGATDVQELLNSNGVVELNAVIHDLGFGALTRDDDVFLLSEKTAARHGVENRHVRLHITGENVRDWTVSGVDAALWPNHMESLEPELSPATEPLFWPFKRQLCDRVAYGLSQIQRGLQWYEYSMFFKNRFRSSKQITFAAVATHNHFVLLEGPNLFNRHAPIIILPNEASEDEHLAIVGLLNSSTAGFWMKQVFQDKGSGGIGGGIGAEKWERRYEHDGTKLKQFPITEAKPIALARRLSALAKKYAALRPEAGIAVAMPTTQQLANAEKALAATQAEMIALQEELDWQCYQLYGLLPDDLRYTGDDLPELALGQRAFEIVMARLIAKGELQTVWFERHGSTPITEIPTHWPAAYRSLVERRITVIETNKEIALIEKPEYKRRWNSEPWDEQEQRALKNWLLDRLEGVFSVQFSVFSELRTENRKLKTENLNLTTTAQITDKVASDAEFLQVAALYRGRSDFDVAALVAELVEGEAVPFLPVLRYKASGLRKREIWERTWELQREEDGARTIGTTKSTNDTKEEGIAKCSVFSVQ